MNDLNEYYDENQGEFDEFNTSFGKLHVDEHLIGSIYLTFDATNQVYKSQFVQELLCHTDVVGTFTTEEREFFNQTFDDPISLIASAMNVNFNRSIENITPESLVQNLNTLTIE